MKEASTRLATRRRAILKITLLSSIVDGTLGLLKITAGILANSHALLADGIHSLSDLASDGGVLMLAWFGSRGPDADHPYGHGRIETLGTMLLGAILILVAGGVGHDAVSRLLQSQYSTPGLLALGVAALSIVAKEWVYQRMRRVARRVGSAMLLANAWHSRSDALSSIAVLVGIGGAMAGWTWLDLLAALVVAGVIAWIGWRLLWQAARELTDTGLPETERQHIHSIAGTVPGVLELRRLRSRTINDDVLLDFDLIVKSDISVSEAHQISLVVGDRLKASNLPIVRTQIHVDPADTTHDSNLPLRQEVLQSLNAAWDNVLSETPYDLHLHYHGEGLDVDILIYGDTLSANWTDLTRAASHLPWLTTIRVWRLQSRQSGASSMHRR